MIFPNKGDRWEISAYGFSQWADAVYPVTYAAVASNRGRSRKRGISRHQIAAWPPAALKSRRRVDPQHERAQA
jgi:hypothetical protein